MLELVRAGGLDMAAMIRGIGSTVVERAAVGSILEGWFSHWRGACCLQLLAGSRPGGRPPFLLHGKKGGKETCPV